MRTSNLGCAVGASDVTRDGRVLKLGGALAVLGGLGYLASTLTHGDLPDATTELSLQHIAARPEWSLIHLLGIVAVLLWVGAFAALAHSLPADLSGFVGRLAVLAVAVGAAIFIVDYSIDGFVAKQAADMWVVTSGPAKEVRLALAEVVLSLLGGTFRSFIAWLFGLPFLLLGTAVALSRQYSRWLGLVAAAGGAGAVVAGATRFVGLDIVPFPVLFGAFVIPLNLWLAVMGVLLWRRG